MSFPYRPTTSQVASWFPANHKITPLPQTSLLNPYGLTLRQTITSSGTVTIPAGVTWVFAILTSGGGGSFFGYGGHGGEVTWGWTLAQSTCIVGAGGGIFGDGGYSRYGHLIANGLNTRGRLTRQANYYGSPAGITYADSQNFDGTPGANAGGGGGVDPGDGKSGGEGIAGGCGGPGTNSTGAVVGGNGGKGLTGGGGGVGTGTTSGTRTGGNGGNGLGINGVLYTGGTGSSRTGLNGAGGGGAGIAGNGGNASGGTGGNGGLGGGGAGSGGSAVGGAGIIYLFY